MLIIPDNQEHHIKRLFELKEFCIKVEYDLHSVVDTGLACMHAEH